VETVRVIRNTIVRQIQIIKIDNRQSSVKESGTLEDTKQLISGTAGAIVTNG
jgi:hypothetical protein